MPTFACRALCIRATNWSESSQILALFTPDKGRVDVVAKGAHRPKGPFGGAIEPFFLLDATVRSARRRSVDALQILAEVEVIEPFRQLRGDLNRMYAGWYILEHLRTWVQADDPSHKLFELTLSALYEMVSGNPCGVIPAFEMKTLELVGFSPVLDQCVTCGGALKDKVAFTASLGGALCLNCRDEASDVQPVPLGALRYLNAINQAGPSGGSRIQTDISVRVAVRDLLDRFIQYRLGFPFRMRRYIDPGKGGWG